jgi:hypothetical protein
LTFLFLFCTELGAKVHDEMKEGFKRQSARLGIIKFSFSDFEKKLFDLWRKMLHIEKLA